MRKLLLLLALLFVTSPVFATTYYVDYASGSDSNNGTSKSTPWQHAPGMQGCTSNCVTRPNPGDSVILKGGVTWPHAAFPWVFNFASGTSGNNIYFGVDPTWYTGGSWSRPIMNMGDADTPATTTDAFGGGGTGANSHNLGAYFYATY